jgi:hypothetical protein
VEQTAPLICDRDENLANSETDNNDFDFADDRMLEDD